MLHMNFTMDPPEVKDFFFKGSKWDCLNGCPAGGGILVVGMERTAPPPNIMRSMSRGPSECTSLGSENLAEYPAEVAAQQLCQILLGPTPGVKPGSQPYPPVQGGEVGVGVVD